MTKNVKNINTVKSAAGFFFTYAAFYFEGFFCCTKNRIPAELRA